MKRYIFDTLFVFVFIAISSCSYDSESRQSEELSISLKNQTFESLKGNLIGEVNDGTIYLYLSDDVILNKFKTYAQNNKLNITPVKLGLIKQQSKSYLRFYGSDGEVSTIELIVINSSKKVMLGNVSCTSKDCASGGGCIPEGDDCTKCSPNGGSSSGDCDKT